MGEVDIWSIGVILYELVCEEFPFGVKEEDTDLRKISELILNAPLTFENELPQQHYLARDLIERLLERDTRKRLGCGADAHAEIKRAPFFGIDGLEDSDFAIDPSRGRELGFFDCLVARSLKAPR